MTATTEHTTTADPNAALTALLPEIQRVQFLPAADPDRVAVMAEKTRVLDLIRATPAPLPCPDWCGLPEGHPYEEICDDPEFAGDCTRYHVVNPLAMIDVSQVENMVSGVVTLGSVDLSMWNSTGVEIVTPEQARALAAQIPAAVALFERLTDAGQENI